MGFHRRQNCIEHNGRVNWQGILLPDEGETIPRYRKRNQTIRLQNGTAVGAAASVVSMLRQHGLRPEIQVPRANLMQTAARDFNLL